MTTIAQNNRNYLRIVNFWVKNFFRDVEIFVGHCAEIGSKSTKVSKLSVRKKLVCHNVAQPKSNSKHALEYS